MRISVRHGLLAVSLAVAGCYTSLSPASDTPHPTTGSDNPMKIRIQTDKNELTATLEDNATARDFVQLLPLDLTLSDYNRTEKISDLPKKLSTADAPPGIDPSVGDIAYYAPWGNLAIFYREFRYSGGLVKLGTVDSGIEKLREKGPVKVRIELANDD